jgi:hypothetical protein
MGWLDDMRTGLMKAHEWAELEQAIGGGIGISIQLSLSPHRG